MEEKDQAPAVDRLSSEKIKNSRLCRRKIIQCCCFITAIFLILAIVITILIFTVFRMKAPLIKFNNLTITKLELVNGTIPKPGVNVSLRADISMKNPNVASFTYSNTTTILYYRGALVGEARGPPGRGGARRTVRMNVTVDLITDRLMSDPNLLVDLGSGLLAMSSYSKIGGRANIWNIFKRYVIVKLNCTATFNISSQQIYDQKCKKKIHL